VCKFSRGALKRVEVCAMMCAVPVTFKGELNDGSQQLAFFCPTTSLDQCSELLKLNFCHEVNLSPYRSGLAVYSPTEVCENHTVLSRKSLWYIDTGCRFPLLHEELQCTVYVVLQCGQRTVVYFVSFLVRNGRRVCPSFSLLMHCFCIMNAANA